MLPGVQPRPHYPAELYELVHRGTPGDLAFYRRACAGSERILELGCGYGRVLEALADLGPSLIGLERDPELLALAEARCGQLPREQAARIELVLGDMRSFDLSASSDARDGRPFDRILIPHSGIYCLLSEEECVDCLRCVAQHLKPGARLILDAYMADRFHQASEPGDYVDERLDPVVSVEHNGAAYDVFERSCWDRGGQRLDVTYEYLPKAGGEVLQGGVPHRYLLSGQLGALLERAGLRLVSMAGDWNGGPVEPDGEFYVAVAALEGSTR
jgi:SAM-dependent methyltransferase